MLQDELAGRENGLQTRHLTRAKFDPLTGEKIKDGKKRSGYDDIMMVNAVIAALYVDVSETLARQEAKTAEVLAAIEALLIETRDEIDDMESRAARTADGRMVFRDKHGDVVDANGEPVSDEEAASVVWTGLEPTYEEYRAANEKFDRLTNARDEWLGYQTDTLGRIRDRANDPDADHTADDLNGMLDDMDSNQPEIPADLKAVTDFQIAEVTSDFSMPPMGMGGAS